MTSPTPDWVNLDYVGQPPPPDDQDTEDLKYALARLHQAKWCLAYCALAALAAAPFFLIDTEAGATAAAIAAYWVGRWREQILQHQRVAAMYADPIIEREANP